MFDQHHSSWPWVKHAQNSRGAMTNLKDCACVQHLAALCYAWLRTCRHLLYLWGEVDCCPCPVAQKELMYECAWGSWSTTTSRAAWILLNIWYGLHCLTSSAIYDPGRRYQGSFGATDPVFPITPHDKKTGPWRLLRTCARHYRERIRRMAARWFGWTIQIIKSKHWHAVNRFEQ